MNYNNFLFSKIILNYFHLQRDEELAEDKFFKIFIYSLSL